MESYRKIQLPNFTFQPEGKKEKKAISYKNILKMKHK